MEKSQKTKKNNDINNKEVNEILVEMNILHRRQTE